MKRDKLLSDLLKICSVVGLIAYVPAFAASIHDRLWSVAAIDTAMYALIVVLAIANGVKAEIKLFVVIGASLLVGATAILAARQQSIGYVWMMVGVVMASLFGRPRNVVVTIAAAVAASGASAVYLIGKGDEGGLTVETASVAVTSLLVVSIFIAIVVRQLLDGLRAALIESSELSERLADELRESQSVRAKLQTKLANEERLLRELQHRVRNNLQTVLSLLGNDLGDGVKGESPMGVAKRRIRALAATNDLYLSSASGVVEVYELTRSALMLASDGAVEFTLEGSTSDSAPTLEPNAAGLAAVLLSDTLGRLADAGIGAAIVVRDDGVGITISVRAEVDAAIEVRSLADRALRDALSSRLAAGAEPEIRLQPFYDEAGHAFRLDISIRPA